MHLGMRAYLAVTRRASWSCLAVQNDWAYVKGINDYGKEQTYMYLAERKGSEDDLMGTPLSEMVGLNLGRWSFVATPYFIALFAPLALCTLSIGSKYIA